EVISVHLKHVKPGEGIAKHGAINRGYRTGTGSSEKINQALSVRERPAVADSDDVGPVPNLKILRRIKGIRLQACENRFAAQCGALQIFHQAIVDNEIGLRTRYRALTAECQNVRGARNGDEYCQD